MATRARSLAREPTIDLHEVDVHAWTVRQAALLRSGELGRVDLANIAEEIETLDRSERAALRSAYRLNANARLISPSRPADRRCGGASARP